MNECKDKYVFLTNLSKLLRDASRILFILAFLAFLVPVPEAWELLIAGILAFLLRNRILWG